MIRPISRRVLLTQMTLASETLRPSTLSSDLERRPTRLIASRNQVSHSNEECRERATLPGPKPVLLIWTYSKILAISRISRSWCECIIGTG